MFVASLPKYKSLNCSWSGVGRAAGWIYPVSTLLDRGTMDVVECNVPVKSAAAFFGEMCAPDGLARFYNPFGTVYNFISYFVSLYQSINKLLWHHYDCMRLQSMA